MPVLIFVSSLIGYISQFKYVSVDFVSTQLCCKPASSILTVPKFTSSHGVFLSQLPAAQGLQYFCFIPLLSSSLFQVPFFARLVGLLPLGVNCQIFKGSKGGVEVCSASVLSYLQLCRGCLLQRSAYSARKQVAHCGNQFSDRCETELKTILLHFSLFKAKFFLFFF